MTDNCRLAGDRIRMHNEHVRRNRLTALHGLVQAPQVRTGIGNDNNYMGKVGIVYDLRAG
jgi:hypothetical protein